MATDTGDVGRGSVDVDRMPTLLNRVLRPMSAALCITWIWAGLLFAGIVVQFSYHVWEFLDTPYELYLAKSLNIKGIVIHGFTADVEYRPCFVSALT